MKVINNIAKINIKILGIALIVYSFLVIHKVMAMSVEEAAVLQPYGMLAFLLGAGSAFLRFAQRQFPRMKRGFDIVLASLGVVVTFPLVAISALLIKLFSPQGPVFYTQTRVGMNGKIFEIYKLRSMKPDAEKGTGAVWADEDNDPRVIPVIGNFLRKSHIDEIPQFINVLMGDMSVVGPRPERPEIVSELKVKVFQYEKRLNVRPGITGLAQIRHRYDKTLTDVKKKVKLDLLYIRKMCLIGELRILFLTVLVVIKGKVIG
ncbi:MAG: sugar transferase [Candidatus Omnitrophica bacterium]|nr:sugar transferase [Candidatus Omnitrophota bacterium]